MYNPSRAGRSFAGPFAQLELLFELLSKLGGQGRLLPGLLAVLRKPNTSYGRLVILGAALSEYLEAVNFGLVVIHLRGQNYRCREVF